MAVAGDCGPYGRVTSFVFVHRCPAQSAAVRGGSHSVPASGCRLPVACPHLQQEPKGAAARSTWLRCCAGSCHADELAAAMTCHCLGPKTSQQLFVEKFQGLNTIG